MRKYIILFALCVFFAGISYYLVNTLNPFDNTQIAQLVQSQQISASAEFDSVITDLLNKGLITEFLDVRNVVILSSTIVMSILCGFMFLHISIDKLFFRKFYEQPSLLLAFRRGLFLCLGIISIFIYRLYAAEWYLAALTVGLLIIVELVIGRLVPAKPVVEDEDGLPQTEGQADEKAETKPKEFKFTMPKFKEWPGKFRETVMRQVGEQQPQPEIPEVSEAESEEEDETNA